MTITMTVLGLVLTVRYTTGTHYEAKVLACHGGRYNPCDILVETSSGAQVLASANLHKNLSGQTIRVTVHGSAPWREVEQLHNPWAWPDISGIFVLAALGLVPAASSCARHTEFSACAASPRDATRLRRNGIRTKGGRHARVAA